MGSESHLSASPVQSMRSPGSRHLAAGRNRSRKARANATRKPRASRLPRLHGRRGKAPGSGSRGAPADPRRRRPGRAGQAALRGSSGFSFSNTAASASRSARRHRNLVIAGASELAADLVDCARSRRGPRPASTISRICSTAAICVNEAVASRRRAPEEMPNSLAKSARVRASSEKPTNVSRRSCPACCSAVPRTSAGSAIGSIPAPLQSAASAGPQFLVVASTWVHGAGGGAGGGTRGAASRATAAPPATHAACASRSRRPVEMKFFTSKDESRSVTLTGATPGREIVAAGDSDLDLVLADAESVASSRARAAGRDRAPRRSR